MVEKIKGVTLPITALGFIAANIDFKETYEDYVDRLTEYYTQNKNEIREKYLANCEEISSQLVRKYIEHGEWKKEPLLPPNLKPEEYLDKDLPEWPLADRWNAIIDFLVKETIASESSGNQATLNFYHPHKDSGHTTTLYTADLQRMMNSVLLALKDEIEDEEFRTIIISDSSFKLNQLRELKGFAKMFPVFRTVKEYGPIDPDEPWLDDPEAAVLFNDMLYAEAKEHYPGNGFGVTAQNRRNYCRRMLAENNTKYLGERITAVEINLELLRQFAMINKFDVNFDKKTKGERIDSQGAAIVGEIMYDYLLSKLRKGEEVYGYNYEAAHEENLRQVQNNVTIEEEFLDIAETSSRRAHLNKEEVRVTAQQIVSFFDKMEETLWTIMEVIKNWLLGLIE